MPPRRIPWTIVLTLPLALLALLWATTHDVSTVAAAATTTYAGCPGHSPNFATIQEAVNNTAPGGVVNICPGVFDESVDLMTMNGGAGVGNITLRKEPSVAGTVDWTAPGSALYVSDIFTGNITVQDVYIHDALGNGVSLDGPIVGSVNIANVQSYRNRAFGFYIDATQGLTIVNTTANKNAEAGFSLIGDPGAPTMHLEKLQANDNDLGGIFIPVAGSLDLLDSEANDNGSTLLAGPQSSGVFVMSVLGDPCNASVQSSSPSVHIENTEASRNAGYGFWVLSFAGPVELNDATAKDNGFDGVAVQSGVVAQAGAGPCTSGSIAVTNSTADNNGWYYGAFVKGAVEAANGLIGPFAGFRLIGAQIAVDGADATANENYGFCLFPFGSAATVVNSTAADNVEDGILQDPDICANLLGSAANFAGAAGIAAVPAEVLTPQFVSFAALAVSNTTSSGNIGAGIHINADYTAMTVTNVTAQNNGTGILISSTIALDAAVVSQIPHQIVNSLIQSNTGSGVAFEEGLYDVFGANAVVAPAATAVITGNVICENGAGLSINQTPIVPTGAIAPAVTLFPSAVVADARGNWWGNAGGPNPPGSGNAIIRGTGIVSDTPWINTFLASAVPNPTIPGYPTLASFRFADAGQTYFLQEGVGNLNEPPIFTISSDNGVIAAAASINQFLHDSRLRAVVTPTVSGNVKISVAGPCGLNPSLTVPVAAPAVSISKSPDLQGAPQGGSATFTVTVLNTGNIDLTAIAVSDPQAPDCSRTAGVIANLGPGQQSVYSCPVTVNDSFVNTATVTAQALVNNTPSGLPISDSDDATVLAGSLSLTRTVWVDGYNPACQTIDKSLTIVPAGTTVKYCFTVTNTGDYTFTKHSLNDSRLGAIFGNFPHDLPPGASYSNVEAGVPATETITANITGLTTWTGVLADPILALDAVDAAAATAGQVVDATATRAIVLSQPGDDQDNDGVDDITEGAGDLNNNDIPDFLDATPTGEEEEEQPGRPDTLLLPNLTR